MNEFGLTGSETLLSQFIQDLSADPNYSICIITTRKTSTLSSNINQNIQIEYFSPSFSLADKVKSYFGLDVISPKLKKLMGDYQPDIIYLNTINNAYLLPYLKQFKAKKILHIHELLMGLNTMNSSDFTNMLEQTDELVACSELVVKLYSDIYSGPITQINSTQQYLVSRSLPIKEEILSTSPTIKIVCAGTICYRKGFDRFLEAAQYLSSDRFELYWFGQYDRSAYSSWVKRKLTLEKFKHVHIKSLPSQELYLTELATCDLFLFTSREESMGMVLMDAIECNLPIISLEDNGSTLILKGSVNKIIHLEDLKLIEQLVIDTLSAHKQTKIPAQQPFQYELEFASFKALLDKA
jgi:glycosyltransferase involved in cell wall biosynthesis